MPYNYDKLAVAFAGISCHLGHGDQAELACCGITYQLDSGEAVTQGQDRDISGGIYIVTPPTARELKEAHATDERAGKN